MRNVRHAWTNRIGRLLAILLLAMVSALLLATPVRADGVTVTLSTSNGTNFTYDGTQPLFTMVVTFTTKPTINNCGQEYVHIDSGQDTAVGLGPSVSPDGLTWTFTQIRPVGTIPVGPHTAVARFLAPGVSCTTVYSSAVSFTVNKATFALTCGLDGSDAYLGINGQTLHVLMAPYSGSGQLPTELQTGTYNVSLDGPTHVAATNLTLNSNNEATITGPTQIGLYQLTCTFNGSVSYTPSTITDTNPYMFSALHSLGVVKLYTNPTTLTAGRGADFYVVFHPAPGLPMPTGEYSIWLGQSHTMLMTLASTGANLVHVDKIPVLAGVSNIEIFYGGDLYYAPSSVDFPLTNPSIPSGTGSGGTGTSGGSFGGSPQGTATAQGTPSATATTESDNATPTAVGAGTVAPTTHPSSGDNGGLWLIVILALVGLIVAGGAVGAGIFLIRRARISAGVGPQTPRDFYVPPSYAPPSGGTWPPLYDDR
ncbi:MAG TPA: hypothetical protein VJO13_15880 [Ktedonobacterales bacterium]|nr:hypothetical protein [Ktedonobacterales bacterium]